MAVTFLDNLDVTNNQVLNMLLQQLGADITPATANKGKIYYYTSTNQVKISNGASLDLLTNVLESISVGTANGLSVSGIAGKNQQVSLALAAGGSAGAMSSAHYSLVNGATSAATASTLVLRDGSNNFSAGTITASLTGTASNATNLNNQAASYYLDRTNHTGTQTAATISNLATVVQAYRLDQFAAPTGAVSFNSQRITGVASPTADTDAANKQYVDATATGLDFKASVRVATTAAISGSPAFSSNGGSNGKGGYTSTPNAVDGVNLAVGDRILVKNQGASGLQHGIYRVDTVGTGANGVWSRTTDFDDNAEVTSGAFMFVEEGTTNATTSWVLSTANPITVNTTSLTFTQFGGGQTYTAGNGISLSGNAFSVKVDTTSTNPNSLSVGANGVTIATTYVGQASITTLGTITTGVWNGTTIAVANGGTGATTATAARSNLGATGKYAQTLSSSATSYTVNHALGTTDVDVVVKDANTNAQVYPTVVITDANNVTVSFSTAPAANAYRVAVFG